MGSKKQLTINLVAQIVAFAVNLFVSFFVTPYIIEMVGVDAYGFVGLSNEFIGYAQIITVALNSMASRFITIKLHEKDYESANKYFNSVLIANVILGVILGIVGAFVIIFIDKIINVPKNLLQDVRLLWVLMFSNFLLTIITSVFGVATFAKNKLYLSSLRQIDAQGLRLIILIICLYFLPPSTWYIGLAAFIFTSFTSWCNYRYTKQLLPEIKISTKYFDFKKLKDILSSGIWNTVTKISGLLSSGLDLLITNKFVGATAMGILSLSKTVPNLILSMFSTMASVFVPELTISYAKKEYTGMKDQLNFSIKLLGYVSCIPMAILFAYGHNFYALWAPTQDAMLLQRLSIITCFAFVLSLPLEPLWNVFTVHNKVKQSSLYLVINSFLTLIIVFILLNVTTDINTKLYIVAGVSTCFSIIRSLTFLPLYSAKCLNFKWNTFYGTIFKNILSVIILTVIAKLIGSVVSISNWYELFVACVLVGILACILNFYIILSKKEREMMLRKIKNITIRIIEKFHTVFTKTKDNYIVFETEGDFCDNGRALYEYMIANRYNEKYHITWIVTNPEKYNKNVPRNVKFISRLDNKLSSKWELYKVINQTKYFFFTHPYWLERRKKDQVVINLWHGTPLKAGGRDLHKIYDYITVPSEFTKELFHKFVGSLDEQYFITGSPRTDLLFTKNDSISQIIEKNKNEKVVICMTTFKQSDQMKDSSIIYPYILPVINSVQDLEKLNKYLQKINIKIIIKIHHLQKTKLIDKVDLSNITYLEDCDLINKDIQLYELIGQTDALITDYSSIMFDYMLINKPIAYFINDLEEYRSKRGFLVDNIYDYMIGNKMISIEDLYEFFNQLNSGIDLYKKERQTLNKKLNKYKDGNCKRILDRFMIKKD